MSENFNIEGMDEFMQKLNALKDRKAINRKARAAARKAMQLVQMSAAIGASRIDDPETRERIQDNIAIRNGKSRDLNQVIMRVGILGGASFSNKNPPNTPGGDTRHWRWIEFGSSHNVAVPFMRPALLRNIDVVTNEFKKVFMKSIEAAINKGKIE